MEGRAGDSSFLVGITPSSAPSFNEAQAFTACEIGYWISPKSGRVFGPDNTNFILPSLRAQKDSRGCGHRPAFRCHDFCARCRSESIADPEDGTRWTLTYKRGTLEIFFAAPNGAAESLGAVSLGVHEAGCSICPLLQETRARSFCLGLNAAWRGQGDGHSRATCPINHTQWLYFSSPRSRDLMPRSHGPLQRDGASGEARASRITAGILTSLPLWCLARCIMRFRPLTWRLCGGRPGMTCLNARRRSAAS